MPAATLVSLLPVCVFASAAAGERATGPAERPFLARAPGRRRRRPSDGLRASSRGSTVLTGPSADAADAIVLDYVRAQEAASGSRRRRPRGLRLVRDETDAFGVRHLLWAQDGRHPCGRQRPSRQRHGRSHPQRARRAHPRPRAPCRGAAVSGGEAVAATFRHADGDGRTACAGRAPRRGADDSLRRPRRVPGPRRHRTRREARPAGDADVDSDEVYTSWSTPRAARSWPASTRSRTWTRPARPGSTTGRASGGTAALANWTAAAGCPQTRRS